MYYSGRCAESIDFGERQPAVVKVREESLSESMSKRNEKKSKGLERQSLENWMQDLGVGW